MKKLAALLLFLAPAVSEAEKIYFNGTDHKAGYYIVPDDLPEEGRKLWVAVDVHGAGGLRNDKAGPGLAKLLGPEPVIVIVPSFTDGYQAGDGKWAEQLIDNFKTVAENHEVHDRMFIRGHSGGAQFAHRFAFTEPKHVIGVSATSAGSWACAGGYGKISSRAKDIPFAIGCGEKDTALSVSGSAHNRIEWYRLFAEELEKSGFVVCGETWPGVGHGVPAGLYLASLKECFLLATQGIEPTSGKWKGDIGKLASERRREYGGPSAEASNRAATANHAELSAANRQIVSGNTPDVSATLRFLVKHPAPGWAELEQYAALKAHCKRTAEQYLKEKAAGGNPLAGAELENFRKVTKGLNLADQAP